MDNNGKPWGEIIPLFKDELRRCQYPISNISCLTAKISELEAYGYSQGAECYSFELGQRFLTLFYPMTGQFKTWRDIDAQTRNSYWAVGLLNDLFLHGYFTITKNSRVLPLKEEDELLLINFQKYQFENGFAETSAKRVTLSIRSFLTYLNSHSVNVSDISDKEIIGFLSAYIDKSKPYINTIILALKRFSDFLFANGLTENKVSSFIPPLNKMVSPRVPSVWSDDEITKMLESVDRGSPLGKRDYAILMIAIKLGLRCSDIKSLQLSDIDVDLVQGTIFIKDSKFGKERLLPVHDNLLKRMKIYHSNVLAFCGPDAPFFPNGRNGAYTTGGLYSIFRERLLAAGISHGGKGNGPRVHDLRHTFAVHSLRKAVKNGEDINSMLKYLSVYLGHSGVISSENYLRLTADVYPDIICKMEEQFDVIPDMEDINETD